MFNLKVVVVIVALSCELTTHGQHIQMSVHFVYVLKCISIVNKSYTIIKCIPL